jgi:hypothetical protein
MRLRPSKWVNSVARGRLLGVSDRNLVNKITMAERCGPRSAISHFLFLASTTFRMGTGKTCQRRVAICEGRPNVIVASRLADEYL